MRRLITFPPLYFFGCIVFALACYGLFPHSTLIRYPFNLVGVLPLTIGLSVLKRTSKLFNERKTTFLLEKPSVFVTEGNFKFSRNPMYFGSLLFIAGISVLIGNSAGLFSPLLFFLTINFLCIPPEERLMEKTFGSDYLDYKDKVRRWI